MLQALTYTNLGLAFALELAMLAAYAIWAMNLDAAFWWRIVVAVITIAAAILVWGLWAAPTSSTRLAALPLLALKVAMFGLAVAALWAAGWQGAAIGFAVLTVANFTLAGVWGQG